MFQHKKTETEAVLHSSAPEDASPQNICEISFPTSYMSIPITYNLPIRHNRGKPPNRYSPDIEERRLKHPITDYVSTEKL